MALIIVGLVALVGAGLLFWGRLASIAKVQQLKTAQHRTAAELAEMAEEVAGELGPGSYNEQVEMRGLIECDNPLVSELSQTPCVYYRMSIYRKYEEQYEEYDQQNERSVIRTRQGRDSIASNTRSCSFTLRDESGRIEVMPDGASIDAEKVLASFEPENRMLGGNGMQLSFGNFRMSMGGGMGMGMGMGGGGRRTLGYELEEWALPVGRNVYVLGEASDGEGRLALHKPSQRANKFLISPKSKQALIQSNQNKALGFTIGAAIAALAGLGLMVGGLIQAITK